MNTVEYSWKSKKISVSICVCLSLALFVLFSNACSEFKKSKPTPFYAETEPPQKKEFRWSNGELPKSFDPALAFAPPETDVVRAIYEGLTDTDARTLDTVPAIAVDWSTSDDYRTWIFKLRHDARWSNGERITAQDFVRSWKRLVALGEKVPHFQLLSNIDGAQAAKNRGKTDLSERTERKEINRNSSSPSSKPNTDARNGKEPENNLQSDAKQETAQVNSPPEKPEKHQQNSEPPVKIEQKFGAEAIDDFTLKVSLLKSDKGFPALAAHPLFRPVYADGKYFETGKLNADIVTSGAFRVLSVAPDGITLERAENFWNKSKVELERVHFVPMENAEKALEAYRAGELDAVTNADFEPLALKLLTPFDDFQRTAHSALNFYEFNLKKSPFDDRRVREALTIAVERERLTEDELDGASLPAFSFSPFDEEKNLKLSQNVERAKNLLAGAGFAGGENFPTVKLVVNRNNVQQRIARAVAKMWKQNLNVSTEIVVKEQSELDAARRTRDFDILRRGVVLPTTDEASNMQAIFAVADNKTEGSIAEKTRADKMETVNEDKNAIAGNPPDDLAISEGKNNESLAASTRTNENTATPNENADSSRVFMTENEAMTELPAIPLYFPTSYSLVKPFIHGFETNTLDAPSLKDVSIDNDWQPKKAKGES